jgi:hypothetical protein
VTLRGGCRSPGCSPGRGSRRGSPGCGLAYYSRRYRLRPGADLPGLPVTRIVAGLDEFTVGIWGGANGTMLLCIAPLAADKRFRAVRDPAVFTALDSAS